MSLKMIGGILAVKVGHEVQHQRLLLNILQHLRLLVHAHAMVDWRQGRQLLRLRVLRK